MDLHAVVRSNRWTGSAGSRLRRLLTSWIESHAALAGLGSIARGELIGLNLRLFIGVPLPLVWLCGRLARVTVFGAKGKLFSGENVLRCADEIRL